MKSNHLIFPLAAVALLLVSCDKQEGPARYEGFEDHSSWTDSNPEAFWDKQPDGLRLDTVWNGDTILYF